MPPVQLDAFGFFGIQTSNSLSHDQEIAKNWFPAISLARKIASFSFARFWWLVIPMGLARACRVESRHRGTGSFRRYVADIFSKLEAAKLHFAPLWSSQILPVIWYTKRNLLYHLNMHSKRFQTFKTGVYCLRFHIFKLAFQQGVEFWATRIQSCPMACGLSYLPHNTRRAFLRVHGKMDGSRVLPFRKYTALPSLYIAQFFGVKHQRPHFWWLWDMVTARTMKFTTCRLREYRHSSVFGKGRLMLRCGRDKQHTPCFKNTLVHNFLVTLVLWMCLSVCCRWGNRVTSLHPSWCFALLNDPFDCVSFVSWGTLCGKVNVGMDQNLWTSIFFWMNIHASEFFWVCIISFHWWKILIYWKIWKQTSIFIYFHDTDPPWAARHHFHNTSESKRSWFFMKQLWMLGHSHSRSLDRTPDSTMISVPGSTEKWVRLINWVISQWQSLLGNWDLKPLDGMGLKTVP